MRVFVFGAWLAFTMMSSGAQAHEIRPAYLEITETAHGRYDLTWRTPLLSGQRLPIALSLPSDVRLTSTPTVSEMSDSVVERRSIEVVGGLEGKRVNFVGLEATITDVLVRTQSLDGVHASVVVRPSQPWVEVAAHRDLTAIAWDFMRQGFEHILTGIDHLLFVLGLMLLVRNPWMLVKTITAFTVAHSLTLALAVFGVVRLPGAPLNAAIALSILFLGVETLRAARGETSLAIRQPWITAFAFGLLHGVGFASGLTLLGLPRGDVPFALLTFNVGVELGQLAFVGVILTAAWSLKIVQPNWPRAAQLAPAYFVGSLGAFWSIVRVTTMLGA
jgi:hydrogenase/urease accessory protein HupE